MGIVTVLFALEIFTELMNLLVQLPWFFFFFMDGTACEICISIVVCINDLFTHNASFEI